MQKNPCPPAGLIPYLIVRGAREAAAFYERVLAAELLYELALEDGRVGHMELAIGSSHFMLADEFPEMDCLGPASRGGSSVSLALYVPDVDEVSARAASAGATLTRPIKNEFYGDRVAHLTDPFGHRWSLHTRVEDVSPDEMRARMTQAQ